MKEWLIILAILGAAMYIGGCIHSVGNAIAIGMAELVKKLDEVNEKVDIIVQNTEDIEGMVSGRKEKYVNPIDL